MQFTKFPFPVSVNQIYKTVGFRGGHTRRAKSQKYVAYINDCRIWTMRNRTAIHSLRHLVLEFVKCPETFVRLNVDLIVPYKKLYTKKGTVKKIDCSNRIKALLDMVSQIIGVDDSRFFLGSVEFVIGSGEYVNIDFSSVKVRRFD